MKKYPWLRPITFLTIGFGVGFALLHFFIAKPKRLHHFATKTHAHWFIDPMNGKDTSSVVLRVENDTLARTITNIDIDNGDTTYKKAWRRDTFYFVPFADTARDINKKPIYDSSRKKWKDTVIFRLWPNQYIIFDANRNYPF